MNIKDVLAFRKVTATVIANDSSASAVVLDAQAGGRHRLCMLIRNTGGVDIEVFYGDDSAPTGDGVTVEAGGVRAYPQELAFPLSISARSKTEGEGAVELDWVEVSKA